MKFFIFPIFFLILDRSFKTTCEDFYYQLNGFFILSDLQYISIFFFSTSPTTNECCDVSRRWSNSSHVGPSWWRRRVCDVIICSFLWKNNIIVYLVIIKSKQVNFKQVGYNTENFLPFWKRIQTVYFSLIKSNFLTDT